MISLHVQQLSKNFGDNRVFRDVTFRHESGILGIAGPNGSGKSTLLKCLTGLLRPTSGTISWKDDGHVGEEEKLPMEAVKQKVGYAAPYISLYRELTVSENIAFLARLRKLEMKESDIAELLGRVDLDHISDKPFQHLSTGQQQRARLASALFMDPPVIILDEPGSNLDENGRQVVSRLVREAKNRQKMVLLASNNPAELELCDSIYSVCREQRV